jgi:hypothetical protein
MTFASHFITSCYRSSRARLKALAMKPTETG